MQMPNEVAVCTAAGDALAKEMQPNVAPESRDVRQHAGDSMKKAPQCGALGAADAFDH